MEKKVVNLDVTSENTTRKVRRLDLTEAQDVDVSNGQIYNISTSIAIFTVIFEC